MVDIWGKFKNYRYFINEPIRRYPNINREGVFMIKKETLKQKEQTIIQVGKFAFANMKKRGTVPLDKKNKSMLEDEYLEHLLNIVRNDHFKELKTA